MVCSIGRLTFKVWFSLSWIHNWSPCHFSPVVQSIPLLVTVSPRQILLRGPRRLDEYPLLCRQILIAGSFELHNLVRLWWCIREPDPRYHFSSGIYLSILAIAVFYSTSANDFAGVTPFVFGLMAACLASSADLCRWAASTGAWSLKFGMTAFAQSIDAWIYFVSSPLLGGCNSTFLSRYAERQRFCRILNIKDRPLSGRRTSTTSGLPQTVTSPPLLTSGRVQRGISADQNTT